MMTKGAVVVAFALSVCRWGLPSAYAQQQPEQQAEHQMSYNVAIVSDYRYRGISQTRLDPALQGGADYTHTPTGLYAGTWLSTITWTRDAGGKGDAEWDLYGGKRGEIGNGVSYDVGGLYYYYPDNSLGPNANTFELYAQLLYGPGYVKYSHSLTNLFGTPGSKSSGYLDIGGNVDTGWYGLVLVLHAGHQYVKHHDALSYTDYKVGVTRDFGVATVGLAWVKAATNAYRTPDGRILGRSTALLSFSRTF
jgi:uncharacterized protein (TIGR02001 family)